MISALSSRYFADLLSSAGKSALKQSIKKKINAVLHQSQVEQRLFQRFCNAVAMQEQADGDCTGRFRERVSRNNANRQLTTTNQFTEEDNQMPKQTTTPEPTEPEEAGSPVDSEAESGQDKQNIRVFDSQPAVKTVQFAPISESDEPRHQNPMDLILNVEVQAAVELGRASLQVKDVLELGPGPWSSWKSSPEIPWMCWSTTSPSRVEKWSSSTRTSA